MAATLTAEIPRAVTTPARPRQTARGRRTVCQPDRALRRTRRDVLRLLAGSDGASFPHRPRRRVSSGSTTAPSR